MKRWLGGRAGRVKGDERGRGAHVVEVEIPLYPFFICLFFLLRLNPRHGSLLFRHRWRVRRDTLFWGKCKKQRKCEIHRLAKMPNSAYCSRHVLL